MTTKVPIELSSTPSIVDGGNATAITIDSSENVGIGITSSLEKFTVSNSSSGIVGRFTNNTNQTLDLGVVSGSGAAGGVYYNSANSGYHAFQVGGSEAMRLDSTGAVTKPLQPAFSVTRDAYQSNLATGSAVAVVWQTEIFDQNSDFASDTFTAPVTGKYQFNVAMRLNAIDSAAAYYQTHLQTSNRNYEIDLLDPTEFNGDLQFHTVKGSILADMDANDTAIISIYQSGGTAQTDVSYSEDTHWSGVLVC